MMRKYTLFCFMLLFYIFVLTGCGNRKEEDNLYGNIIAELGDDEQFSLTDIGEENLILFTTDMTYDDGNGHNAALSCNVYFSADGGELYPLGKIESMGTAYPVSYGEKCIYTASGHSLSVYRFDSKKKQWRASQYEEVFDTDGNVTYTLTEDDKTETISEKEYLAAMEEYAKSSVVDFGYGASDNPI